MMVVSHSVKPFVAISTNTELFRDDVLAGLSRRPRSLPCKYFYDQRGSRLFDEICNLDEYYLTRAELAIMEESAAQMAEQIGTGVMLVEYGSGSSIKTRILLDHLDQPVAYVPVDISREHLEQSADELARLYPYIEVLPTCADFTQDFELPTPNREETHNAVYFPGSTIGNFQPDAAQAMLARIVRLCRCGGGLLIGIDLQKDVAILEAAYDDDGGVTAEFNLNLLNRINRELDGDIRIQEFEHQARYNDCLNRIEMYLVSRCDQTVNVGDQSFDFARGETILTESSHKYTIEGFAKMAATAHLTLRKSWTDDKNQFAVLHLVVSN